MLITIIVFLLIIGFLVLVHEIGHFFAAKKSSMAVDEFGIGFPPTVYKKKIHKTVYAINFIPLGGYVKIKGEDGSLGNEMDSFSARPIWQRIIVIISGVGMNILAGVVLFILLYSIKAPIEITDDIDAKYILDRQILISEVIVESPASEASLKVGDEVISLDGKIINSIEMFQDEIASSDKDIVVLGYKREGGYVETNISPKVMQEISMERKVIGVGLSEMGNVRFPLHKAVVWGVKSSVDYIQAIASAFFSIIKGAFSGNGISEEMGGPVAIAVMTNQAVNLGLSRVLIFTAILSFNLAILNILPFPALDGGRLVFLVVEAVRGKPSRKEVEEWFHRIGFILLILFAIFITYKDLLRFGGRIWQRVIG